MYSYKSNKSSDSLIENLLLSLPGNNFTPLDLKSTDLFTGQREKQKHEIR